MCPGCPRLAKPTEGGGVVLEVILIKGTSYKILNRCYYSAFPYCERQEIKKKNPELVKIKIALYLRDREILSVQSVCLSDTIFYTFISKLLMMVYCVFDSHISVKNTETQASPVDPH